MKGMKVGGTGLRSLSYGPAGSGGNRRDLVVAGLLSILRVLETSFLCLRRIPISPASPGDFYVSFAVRQDCLSWQSTLATQLRGLNGALHVLFIR